MKPTKIVEQIFQEIADEEGFLFQETTGALEAPLRPSETLWPLLREIGYASISLLANKSLQKSLDYYVQRFQNWFHNFSFYEKDLSVSLPLSRPPCEARSSDLHDGVIPKLPRQ